VAVLDKKSHEGSIRAFRPGLWKKRKKGTSRRSKERDIGGNKASEKGSKIEGCPVGRNSLPSGSLGPPGERELRLFKKFASRSTAQRSQATPRLRENTHLLLKEVGMTKKCWEKSHVVNVTSSSAVDQSESIRRIEGISRGPPMETRRSPKTKGREEGARGSPQTTLV